MENKKQLEHIKSIQKVLLNKLPYPQKRISSLLNNMNVSHSNEFVFAFEDRFFFVDIFIHNTHKYLEIDGKFHKDSKQKGNDKFRKSWLRKNFGLKEYRIKNSKAIQITIPELKKLLDI